MDSAPATVRVATPIKEETDEDVNMATSDPSSVMAAAVRAEPSASSAVAAKAPGTLPTDQAKPSSSRPT